ncbi:MAG: hypothetical protein Q9217_004883 [Psora testacea]
MSVILRSMERFTKPPEAKPGDISSQALKVGALTGTTGLLLGSVIGLYRSKHPRVFALASGIGLFAYGSTFWASRKTILHIRPFPDNPYSASPSQKDRLKASTLAGAVAGSFTGALFRGRWGIIPGSFISMAFGYAGQRLYTYLDERHTAQLEGRWVKEEGEERWIDKVKSLRWTGLQKLTDDEYTSMLEGKLWRVEAEISLIDEKIKNLRVRERQQIEDSKETEELSRKE